MSGGATARLFVAIELPAQLRAELSAWARLAVAAMGSAARQGNARSVRLLEAETMHLTLCFLASRPLCEIDQLIDALRQITPSLGELSLGAPLWLPPRRPRALALAVHDRSGELARLHRSVQAALAAAIDWQPERRRFRGHVTVARLGRVRSRDRRDDGGEPALPPTPQLSFSASHLVLYRSWLSPPGASYEALATRALAVSSDSSPEVGGGSGAGP